MLSKTHLDNARKRRDERLTGWIKSIRTERDFGIPRLQREFAHVFKKIEYIPKSVFVGRYADDDESVKSTTLDIKVLISIPVS